MYMQCNFLMNAEGLKEWAATGTGPALRAALEFNLTLSWAEAHFHTRREIILMEQSS